MTPAEPHDTGASTPVDRLAATVERLRREVRAAHAASDGRALIELAKGVLVERLACAPPQAARQLDELAARAGVSRLELAADIVNDAARDALTEAAPDSAARAEASRTDAVAAPSAHDDEAAGPDTAPPDTSVPDAPDNKGVGTAASAAPAHDIPALDAVRMRTAESGALAADDTQAVAESLLEHALAPLGATAVAVWAVGPDGSLTLRAEAGFPADEAGRWRYVPPGVATVARRALTERRAVWLPSLQDARVPSIGVREAPGGRAAIPAGTGGRVHGVMEICWARPLSPQPLRIRRQMEALAELCAHTLATSREEDDAVPGEPAPGVVELVRLTDGLHDPALVLVPELDAQGALVDFRIHHANRHFVDPAERPGDAVRDATLLEAFPMAAAEGDLFEKIEHVYATGESFRAERMTTSALIGHAPHAVVADIGISRHGRAVVLIWRVEDEAARLAGLLQHAQRLGRIGGFEENPATGEITWNQQMFDLHGLPRDAAPFPLEELPARAHPDDAVAVGRFLRTLMHHRRPASAALRLRHAGGVTRHIRVVAEPVLGSDGRLLAIRGAHQDISAQYWTETALAATRDQLAHSEKQTAARDRLALQLQHAIMPPEGPPLDTPGLELAVRYRPAESEAAVGGDWYDTVVLPSEKILVCVGDVAGHGIEAATGMVVLRNALRGLAVTGAGPAQLLAWLNGVAHHLMGQLTATVVCGVYDPVDRVLRWARAGHLPPILVRGEHARTLPLPDGILLGALDDADYGEEELQLSAGDTLLMYTDGLVERRDRSVQHSLSHLLENAQGSAPTLELRLDRLLTHSKADTDDDTCVVGMCVS